MRFFDKIRDFFTGPTIQTLSLSSSMELKKAFELAQIGVTGRAAPVSVNNINLDRCYRRNEIAYACIEKIRQSAIDPTPIVEKSSDGDKWEAVKGHPLARLLNRPNPLEDGPTFWGAWLASEHIFGEAYAEIVRNAMGQPIRLWLLNPQYITPLVGKGEDGSPIVGYEYTFNGHRVTLNPSDILVRRNKDLTNQFHGLSPLAVALGAVDMDTAQTDFARAFFNNGGIPSGLLKFLNKSIKAEEAERTRQRYQANYQKGGQGHGGVLILDQNVDYQKIGANPQEVASDSLRGQSETRICSVFGVPPILISAYVALLHVNQKASVKEAQTDFWTNKMSPLFKSLRSFLTWNLLPEFEEEALIEADKIRVNWDMSQVMALQEDADKRHDRARKDFQAGGISFNEFRSEIGRPADPNGNFYLKPKMAIPITPEVALVEAEKVPTNQPDQLPENSQVN